MLFRRQQVAAPRGALEPTADDLAYADSRCSGLEKALHFVMRREHPHVLDLGPMCGETVTFLAGLGARVTVTEFDAPSTPRRPDDRPLALDQPNASFDLVLAWEHIDFMPPERVKEFANELRRVMTADGWLFLFSRAIHRAPAGRRSRFRVLERNRVARERLDEAPRPRWVHTSRELERALSGFLIEGIHLRRNQVRELVATRAGFDYSAFSVLGEPLQRRTALEPRGERPAAVPPQAAAGPDPAAGGRKPPRRAPRSRPRILASDPPRPPRGR